MISSGYHISRGSLERDVKCLGLADQFPGNRLISDARIQIQCVTTPITASGTLDDVRVPFNALSDDLSIKSLGEVIRVDTCSLAWRVNGGS